MKKSIIIIGARGFEYNYGGWETFVTNLVKNPIGNDFFKIEIAGSASFIIILLIKKYIKKEKTLKKLITWI